MEADDLVAAFEKYMEFGGTPVTRAQLEASMTAKMPDVAFLADTAGLLRAGLSYDPAEAWALVHETLVTRLRGEPWKGEGG